MKTVQFTATKIKVLKLAVILFLAVLVLSFLASNLESYAYFVDSSNADTISVKYEYEEVGTGNVIKETKSGVMAHLDVLPKTGGITPSTLISFLGLASIATGGTIFTILKKKHHGTNN